MARISLLRYGCAMLLQQDSLALIGNTPMVRLAGPSDAT
ncbi:MAG: cysteine synthase A, partial [Sphingobium sp.]